MKQWIARRLPALLTLTAAATVCALLSTFHWFLELFSHFTPYYLAAALALAAAFFALGRKRYASASLALAIVDVAMLSANATPPLQPAQAAAGKTLTVFHFNVGFRHADTGRVVEHLLANAGRYDAIVIVEAGPAWQRQFGRLEKAFPHRLVFLDDSPFGLAVFTREKPDSAALVEAPAGYRRAEVRLPDGRGGHITLYGIHPPPPISGALAAARNESLRHLAGTIARQDGAAVVVGDLNLTPYSPYFRRFADAAGLQPVRSGLFAAPTWPAPLAQMWIGIPIDHGFVSRNAKVLSHEIGPDLGSDHLPVILTVVF